MHFKAVCGYVISVLTCGVAACSSNADEGSSFVEQDLSNTQGTLSAALTLQSQWGSGYCANVSVTNTGTQPTSAWTAAVALNGSTLSNGWSAQLTQASGQLSGSNLSYNGALAPGASTSWGFCGNGSSTPSLVSISGVGGGTGSSGGAGGAGAAGGGGSGGASSATAGRGGGGGAVNVAGAGGKANGGAGSAGTSGSAGSSSACNTGTPGTGGKTYSANTSGNVGNGYAYTYWSNKSGTGSMTVFGQDAKFSATWSNAGDFLARVGLSFNSTETPAQIGTIASDFAETKTGNGGGYSYIGIYGWSQNPLHEYYIVEDWFGSRPVPGTKVGTIVVDGGTYDVLTHTQTNQPAITGANATFVQFWSVRQTARQCGHISISQHFSQWASLGMQLGNLYEAKLLIEAGNNSGSINFTNATVTVN